MSKDGYICLFRKLQDNFLWKEKRVFSRLEAWIDILFAVRFSEIPEETMIKDKVFLVKQGESIKSLDTWANRWNWNKSRTRRFLELLKKRNMIETIGEQKTTHLRVINYAYYVDLVKQKRNKLETNLKQKRNKLETNLTPEEERNKEIKKNNIYKKENEALYVFEKYCELFDSRNMTYHNKTQSIKNIKKLLKDNDKDQLVQYAKNCLSEKGNTEYCYACSNFYGRAEHYKNFDKECLGSNNLSDDNDHNDCDVSEQLEIVKALLGG